MPFIDTGFEGMLVYEPTVFEDERGFFLESYNKQVFEKAGLKADFVQDNRSKSHKGVLRGLHFQVGASAQAKLVTVLQGQVIDFVVDVRKSSATFGKGYTILLTAENKKQLFIPRGFAHGFLVLEDNTEFFYKCDNFYSKQDERGIYLLDPALNFECPLPTESLILSEKDKALPRFADSMDEFHFS
jgi:dTDP-4-dehydrorhamnose 3,5-epimerase